MFRFFKRPQRTGSFGRFFFSFAAMLIMMLSFSSCSESPERIQFKLNEILQDDLKFMVAEVQKGSGDSLLMDSTYYIIRDLHFFHGDSAWKIGAWAQVDFFYMDTSQIPMFQSRKYRYMTKKRFWDRYWKKMLHIGQYSQIKAKND